MQRAHAILFIRHHFARYGNVQVITLSAAKDRAPDRVQFRHAACRHILLHGAAHRCGVVMPEWPEFFRDRRPFCRLPLPHRPRPRRIRGARAKPSRQKFLCLSMSLAVPVSANGPRKASLLHSMVFSSA